ncbi:MAG TPA: DNA/RNA non-specific endonuclease [Clostridia bacterium]
MVVKWRETNKYGEVMEWKKLENDWAEALKEVPPRDVKVKITPIYQGDSQRPEKFDIKYKIGDKWDTVILKNRPGGK